MTDLQLDPRTGLLVPDVYVPSPHYDERPAGMRIDMIVIHAISLPPGEFGGHAVRDFFCGHLNHSAHPYYAGIADLRVSAHLFVRRDGELMQFVPFHYRAWHAGQSVFQGRTSCNDFSIGIELEGSDDHVYETVQYQRLGALVRLLMHHYPDIREDRIVGHTHIAPERKTDPGPHFHWELLRGMIT